jgi:hypothetical protein
MWLGFCRPPHCKGGSLTHLRTIASNEFTTARFRCEDPGARRRRQTARSMGGSCEDDWVLIPTAKVRCPTERKLVFKPLLPEQGHSAGRHVINLRYLQLVLLCHKFNLTSPQHGHRGSLLAIARAMSTRSVEIESGTWRCTRPAAARDVTSRPEVVRQDFSEGSWSPARGSTHTGRPAERSP